MWRASDLSGFCPCLCIIGGLKSQVPVCMWCPKFTFNYMYLTHLQCLEFFMNPPFISSVRQLIIFVEDMQHQSKLSSP